MAKVRIELRRDKIRPNGEIPLYLLIRHKTNRARIRLEAAVRLKDWNPISEEVRKTHPDFVSINDHLEERKTEAKRLLSEMIRAGRRISVAKIKEELEGESGPEEDFVTYARELVDGYRRRGQWSTFKSYQKALNKFEEYLKGTKKKGILHFDEFTPKVIRDFITFCREVRGNNLNTSSKAAEIIRTFIKFAIADRKMDYADNPFIHIQLKWEDADVDPLPIDEIFAIQDIRLDGLIEKVRDRFLFQFYAWGIRFSDIIRLRWSEVEFRGDWWFIRYKMKKTGKTVMMPLPEVACRILESRLQFRKKPDGLIFDMIQESALVDEESYQRARSRANSLANKYLKKIAVLAGLESIRLSTHVARHSIADAMLEAGLTTKEIQNLFRHSSEKQTETYIRKFGRTGLDDKLRALPFFYVSSGSGEETSLPAATDILNP